MNRNMGLFLKTNKTHPQLSYYQNGNHSVIEDKFCLLGFTDNLPVVSSSTIRPSSKSTNHVQGILKVMKVEKDNSGHRFITVNGQKLRVMPTSEVRKEMCKRTILVKKDQLSNNLKNPPPVHVISDASTKTDISLAKATDNSCFKFISFDSPDPDSSESTNAAGTSQSVISTCLPGSLLSVKPILDSSCSNDFDEELLPVFSAKTKLLCERNLNILNQVKMQALNLSLKKNKVMKKFILKREVQKSLVEVGIQTEPEQKNLHHRHVQTEIRQDSFNFLECEDNYSSLHAASVALLSDQSVLLNDVNLGTGPSMKAILNGLEDQSCKDAGALMAKSANGKSVTSDDITRKKKKLMFFNALKECTVYNVAGNLPLHEGVIHNDLDVVKVQCAALKARNLGVNQETHDGCTPLQLAIIHDVQPLIVKTLLDYGADIKEVDGEGNNILHLGAKFMRHEALGIILVHKTFDDYSQCIDDYNFEGLTPLMLCCMRSWTAGALLFIGNKARVNCKDQTSGRTALFHAAEAQNADIVRILLDHHADPKIKNFFGTSPHDAMYELEDMPDVIKNLIFGRSKKRCIEAEMNPLRTAKAVKNLKTYPKLQKIERKGAVFATPSVKLRIQQIK